MCSVTLLIIKMFELLKCLFTTAIMYLGIESVMIKSPNIIILLWFFSHEFMDTRIIP